MKISTNTRYALRFCRGSLRGCPKGLPLPRFRSWRVFRKKCWSGLRQNWPERGLVRSVKGMGGGFELLRPADEITVTQVLTVMETPYLPHHCVEDPEHCCKMSENCHMLSLWVRIDEAVRAVTDSVTVQDLIRPWIAAKRAATV